MDNINLMDAQKGDFPARKNFFAALDGAGRAVVLRQSLINGATSPGEGYRRNPINGFQVSPDSSRQPAGAGERLT